MRGTTDKVPISTALRKTCQRVSEDVHDFAGKLGDGGMPMKEAAGEDTLRRSDHADSHGIINVD